MHTDKYKHYKGGFYRFLIEAMNESDGKNMAVYWRIADGKFFVRPMQEFLGYVTVDGKIIPRFEKQTEVEVESTDG